ncbi:MAG: nicotinate phosphoribosyltransferase [Bacteroidetes bacterium]|nr:MAG: nicotinate phosphoribosyltransferase [Bacteroidota bacterium]
MIISIIDNDLYKFTMQNAVIKIFPRAKVRFQFINRGNTPFPEGFGEILRKEVAKMAELRLTSDEKKYLNEKCTYLDPTYLDFLMGYRYDPSEVGVIQKGDDLQISIEGYWYRTILWEVPLMALISELYFKMSNQVIYDEAKIIDIARKKATQFNMLGISVADFGTRRRYSFENHDRIVKAFKNYGKPSIVGTSNVYFAKKYDLIATGTHAHEWFMFHAAKYGYKMANKLALENWVRVYRGDLGIALSDTFTSEIFYHAFDTKFAKLFDGVRQDSGNPIEFADKTINHYRDLKIDPLSKTIIFSDGLNPETVEKITKHCRDKIKISFGIGTNFTNDVGVKPLNIVIKIIEAQPEGQNWEHTIKLSDTKGKYTGDKESIKLCKEVLKIED